MMLFLRSAYTLLALAVILIYWREYGPVNFLWFSDIAFFAMVPALWLNNRYLASMMAVGVLPLEIMWVVGLVSGGSFLGIAEYMYDASLPLWLRLLSLFHFPMIIAVIYMMVKVGYDKRALIPQIVLSVIVVLLTQRFDNTGEHINMATRPDAVADYISEARYEQLMPFVLVFGVIIPMHFLLKKIAPLKFPG